MLAFLWLTGEFWTSRRLSHNCCSRVSAYRIELFDHPLMEILAMRSLVVGSILILLAASPLTADDKKAPPLKELLALYCELGLPLPPCDSELVIDEEGLVGFVSADKAPAKTRLFLVGTQHYDHQGRRLYGGVEHWRPSAREYRAEHIRTSFPFRINAGLAIALQSEARGESGFARAIGREHSAIGGPPFFRIPLSGKSGCRRRCRYARLGSLGQ